MWCTRSSRRARKWTSRTWRRATSNCATTCPEYKISRVHGKMKAAEKEAEMQDFISGKTQILVATTVIEVGVNVPNASVMVIENAERFGLAQLHQLRGRVGRGADQSYCILVTKFQLSADTRKRIQIMTETNDGFEIAEADLKLRGPGDLEGRSKAGRLLSAVGRLGARRTDCAVGPEPGGIGARRGPQLCGREERDSLEAIGQIAEDDSGLECDILT